MDFSSTPTIDLVYALTSPPAPSNQSYSLTINKSEFIGHAFYVESVDEAEKYISEIREKYKDATHNCFAYIIGVDKLIQKYSDDGEPSGTAGIPMLEVLRKKDLTNSW